MFNHHKCLTDIGVTIRDGLVPKTHQKFNWYKFKRYFSIKRIKEAEDIFDIIFDTSWNDFKDNVEYNYQKKYLNVKDAYEYIDEHESKFSLSKSLVYIYDSIKYAITSRWKAYKNYWQYGFWDYDETYALDWVSTVYLYERLKRYKELASKWVHLYPDGPDDDLENLHKFKDIPVVVLKDIKEIKEAYDKDNSMFFGDESNVVDIELRDMYQYECIDLILDYLETVIKTEDGNHIFKELDTSDKIFSELMDTIGLDHNPIKDENGKIKYYGNPFESISKEQDKRDPDHMFWSCLEEKYVNILQSYAFQIYGKIIKSMWW